jgi:hypothetical protein
LFSSSRSAKSKGWFALRDNTRCHTLGVLDDHSSYNPVLKACRDERAATVRRHLRKAVARYGLPDGMQCDNGSLWGNDLHQPWTPLGVWLLDLGVGVGPLPPLPPPKPRARRSGSTSPWTGR